MWHLSNEKTEIYLCGIVGENALDAFNQVVDRYFIVEEVKSDEEHEQLGRRACENDHRKRLRALLRLRRINVIMGSVDSGICDDKTSEMNNTNKVVVLINECRKLNIKVHAPDINKSGINFEPLNDKEISFGLNAVKNVGIKALEQCIEVREKSGEFKSIFDFISRVDQRLVNKKVLESLILAGAFDSISNNRAQLYEAIDIAIIYGQQIDKQSNKNQIKPNITKMAITQSFFKLEARNIAL